MSNVKNVPNTMGKYLLYLTKGYHFSFFIMFLLSTATFVYSATIMPWLIKEVTNGIINFSGNKENFFSEIGIYFLYIFIFYVVCEILTWVGIIIARNTMPMLAIKSDKLLFSYIQNHSVDYFSSQLSGKLSAKIRDVEGAFRSIRGLMQWTFIPTVFIIIISLFTFASISKAVAGIFILWVTLQLLFIFSSISEWNRTVKEKSEIRSQIAGYFTDVISNITSVKLFSAKKYEERIIDKKQAEQLKASLITWDLPNWVMAKIDIAHTFIYAGLLYYFYYGYMNNLLDLGEILFIFTAKKSLNQYLHRLIWDMPQLTEQIGVGNQALQTLIKEYDVVDIKDANDLAIKSGKIDIKDLKFGYKENKDIIKDLNLNIKAGEKIGLVGTSGAGKSTLVKLLMRLFDLKEGSISIDEQDISKVTQESLHSNIAFVAQETSLFHRSLKENIAYGIEEISEEELITAAKNASAHDFIIETDEGYDTIVGERGIKLSGGQRQRISIARAFLKDSPILILDEATSALDTETEKEIQKSLEKLMKNRTTIAIAHRLSTLSQMDRIVVMENGQITEIGSHNELLEQKGQYHKLWNMQVNGFIPELPKDEVKKVS